MRASLIAISILIMLLSLGAFIISFKQFNEKGFLFNNAFIYASKKEREEMNKKPHYRQSAIVFLFLGIIFFIMAPAIFFNLTWLFYFVTVFIVALIVYATVSSVVINRKG